MDYKNFQSNLPFPSIYENRYWNKYENIIKGLSNEQLNFVSNQKFVIEAKKKMIDSFIDYLFEQHKDAFVSVASGAYREIADNYINTVQSAADSYVPRTQELEQENLAMKQKIEELTKRMEFIEKNKGNADESD